MPEDRSPCRARSAAPKKRRKRSGCPWTAAAPISSTCFLADRCFPGRCECSIGGAESCCVGEWLVSDFWNHRDFCPPGQRHGQRQSCWSPLGLVRPVSVEELWSWFWWTCWTLPRLYGCGRRLVEVPWTRRGPAPPAFARPFSWNQTKSVVWLIHLLLCQLSIDWLIDEDSEDNKKFRVEYWLLTSKLWWIHVTVWSAFCPWFHRDFGWGCWPDFR